MIRRVVVLLLTSWFAPGLHATEFWQFGVYLGDKRIGEHRFELEREDHVERVTSIAQIKARLLFVPIYTYEHAAEEEWAEGCLRSIRSFSRANGKQFTVNGAIEDGRLVIDTAVNGEPASQSFKGCVSAYAYWDRQRLDDATALLNPQTGEMEPAQLVSLGENRRLTTATTSIELWYSHDGHWLGLETTTATGKPLTYRLEDSYRTLAALTSQR